MVREPLSAFNTLRSRLCGLADSAFEDAVRYVKERKAFGGAIGEFSGHTVELGEATVFFEAAQLK
jgi:alkylation response protein AidB-like acyl-CoA dehydrogenase